MRPARSIVLVASALITAGTLLSGCASGTDAAPSTDGTSSVAAPSASLTSMTREDWTSAVTSMYLSTVIPAPDSPTSNVITTTSTSNTMIGGSDTPSTSTTVINPDGSRSSDDGSISFTCNPAGECTATRAGQEGDPVEFTLTSAEEIALTLSNAGIDQPQTTFTSDGNGTYVASIPDALPGIPDSPDTPEITGPYTSTLTFTFPAYSLTVAVTDSDGTAIMTGTSVLTTVPAPGQ